MTVPRKRPPLREIVTDKTLALMLALGFGSGLPFLLILGTQAVRLTEAKVPIETITFISYVAFAYALKFLWAPIIDTVDVPVLAMHLGRRRAWLLVSQIAVAVGLIGLAVGDPATSLTWIIGCAAFTGLAGATQDIVVDGWRIDEAPPDRQGVMAATLNLGYRLAFLCTGAGVLYIADFASWRSGYLTMAALMLIPIIAGLMAPRRAERERGTQTALTNFVEPIADLLKRYGRGFILILALVALYRLPDYLTGVVANPLYITLGFSKSDIATMSKIYGIWIGIAGAFAGGFAVTRIGLMPSLLIGGIASSASHLCLAWLAASGKSIALLALSVSVENFAGNFAGAALIAYMSSLTSPMFAASQYALLSSVYALLGKFLAGWSGLAVKHVGFPEFFIASSSIGIPVTALCVIVWWRGRELTSVADGAEPRDFDPSSAGRA